MTPSKTRFAFFQARHVLKTFKPTAISIVVFSAVSQFAVPGSPEFIKLALTLTLTFLAGMFQLGFGLAKLGTLVNFVSHTVVTGFTAGAAILIATSQMKHVLGISLSRGESFIHTWINIISQLSQVNAFVIAIAAVTLFTAVLFKRLWPDSPNLLFGMIAGSVACFLMKGPEQGVSLLGEIPSHLPPSLLSLFFHLHYPAADPRGLCRSPPGANRSSIHITVRCSKIPAKD